MRPPPRPQHPTGNDRVLGIRSAPRVSPSASSPQETTRVREMPTTLGRWPSTEGCSGHVVSSRRSRWSALKRTHNVRGAGHRARPCWVKPEAHTRAGIAPGARVPQRCSPSAEFVSAFRQLTNRLGERSSRLDCVWCGAHGYYPGNQDPHKSLQPIRSHNSRSRLPGIGDQPRNPPKYTEKRIRINFPFPCPSGFSVVTGL